MPCPWRPLAATMTATSSAGTPRCRSIALDELERHTQARIGGDNPAETTGKFIAAKFEHDTASRLKAMLRPSFTPTGYELEKGKSGAPEIKGYSAAYLGASSPRSQQIKEQLEKTGHSGPRLRRLPPTTLATANSALPPSKFFPRIRRWPRSSAISRSRLSPLPAGEPVRERDLSRTEPGQPRKL